MTRRLRGRSRRHRPLATLLALAAMLTALLTNPASAASATTATVHYRASAAWTTVNIHYAPIGGSWTAVPGVAMAPACTGWHSYTIDLAGATGAQVVFNNGSGTWDNNNGANYRIGSGDITVSGGQIGSGDPCAAAEPDTTAPETPTGLSAMVNATNVILSWTAASDDVATTGYRLTRTSAEGTVTRDTGAVKFTDANLDPNTAYT